MLKVTIESYPAREGFIIIKPHGSIDYNSYQEFQKKIDPELTKPVKGVILDLAGVDYISSSGLGSLISMKKTLSNKKAELYFCNLRPPIKKLFEILKALPAQNVFENTQEADKYLYRLTHPENASE